MSNKDLDGKENENESENEESEYGELGFIDAGLEDVAKDAIKEADNVIVDLNKHISGTQLKRQQFRKEYKDIVRRARVMASKAAPDFKEVKFRDVVGSGPTSTPLLTDLNMMIAFECLFGAADDYEAPDRPYFDTFRGLTVGWNGRVIDDDYDLQPLLGALVEFGMVGPNFDKVEKLFKIFARQKRINSLIERMNRKIPEWDGIKRIDTQLIKMFESFDTELNREFGAYFWLSIYCRAMYPGCNASMVLSIIGGMGNGKSYMAKLICEEMLEDKDADSVSLDWTLDFNDFLRKITGQSVIASVAEMAGFGRAELTKIKNLTTRTVDIMNYKWERDNKQSRQWIMIMDGNDYRGLQRDEQGNRRFYPMFVAQLPNDELGQVQWDTTFSMKIDPSEFRADFWQIMAECREWIEVNKMSGYNRMISTLEIKVKAFSDNEMAHDRGTIRDDDLDTFLIPALKHCDVSVIPKHEFRDDDGHPRRGRPSMRSGIVIYVHDLRRAIMEVSGKSFRIVPAHIKNKLTALGAVSEIVKNQRVFMWPDVFDVKHWERMLEGDEQISIKKVKTVGNFRGNDDGF